MGIHNTSCDNMENKLVGGCGAVAILVGRNAPLVVDRTRVATYSANTQEFCRPVQTFPYPEYSGSQSNYVFFHALLECYRELQDKTHEAHRGDNHADPPAGEGALL